MSAQIILQYLINSENYKNQFTLSHFSLNEDKIASKIHNHWLPRNLQQHQGKISWA